MGLITKEVKMGLIGNRYINHYENLGYIIPRYIDKRGRLVIDRNKELIIKVSDLPNVSHAEVEVKCDHCEKTKLIKWYNYTSCINEDNTYYCQKCAKKIYGEEKANKTKLLKSKSFEKWCIENDRQDVLDRWDYELNIDKDGNVIKPDDISFSSEGTNRKGYWFKCNKYKNHKSELKRISNFTRGQNKSIECNQCNSFAQWGIDNLGEDFLDKYWNYDKNTINPFEIPSQWNNKVWIKCQEKDYHDSYNISCGHFVEGNRCSYCASHEIHPKDSLGQLLEDRGLLYIWSDKNKKSPFGIAKNCIDYAYWNCDNNIHANYKRKINLSNKANFRCPKCVQERDESFLQEKVRLYLNELGYETLHEYDCNLKCINPKNNYLLRYDNEVVGLGLIIEVHGQQHYKLCIWHTKKAKKNETTPEYELHMQQVRDRYKRMYAKHMKYEYLEIPYWTDDKKETWKELVDEITHEIKNIRLLNQLYLNYSMHILIFLIITYYFLGHKAWQLLY